ncbi:MAG: TOBE domain-containing protein, partial [Clostridia bacterium]|nr:TOBE domain-containing protein [Clostridia bacterium]
THDQTEAMTMGTRIVVMKSGFIQQVDTPNNLYLYPCNLFVAGFIGSPQMNFCDAVIAEENGELCVKFGSNTIKLSAAKAEKAKAYVGQTVVMGIRPEDLSDDEDSLAKYADSKVSASVEVTEMMGAETYLYLVIDGMNFVARVKADSTAKIDTTISVAIDPEKIHLFNKETEQVITN